MSPEASRTWWSAAARGRGSYFEAQDLLPGGQELTFQRRSHSQQRLVGGLQLVQLAAVPARDRHELVVVVGLERLERACPGDASSTFLVSVERPRTGTAFCDIPRAATSCRSARTAIRCLSLSISWADTSLAVSRTTSACSIDALNFCMSATGTDPSGVGPLCPSAD